MTAKPAEESGSENVCWNISVPADFDESVRQFLASQKDGAESLSEFVQKAVCMYIVHQLTSEAKGRAAQTDLKQEELDKVIDKEIACARVDKRQQKRMQRYWLKLSLEKNIY